MENLDVSGVDEQPSPRATELIADFHQRHEAWRRQGQSLARLRADLRSAAGREAAAILASARADIRRIVVDARRALLVLTAQLEAIAEQAEVHGEAQDAPADPHADDHVPESVLQARRDLQRLLEDIRPELDEMASQAQLFSTAALGVRTLFRTAAVEVATPSISSSVSPLPSSAGGRAPSGTSAATASAGHTEDDHDHASVEALEPLRFTAGDPRSRALHGKHGMLAALALAAAILAGAGAWFLWGFVGGSADLTPPLASIPSAPRVKPAWQDDRIPTLTASLIAVPSTSFVDRAAAGSPSTAGAPSTVSLDIEVQREAWVQSSVDNTAAAERVFRQGETLRLVGAHDVSIAARDAGAVIVSLNGGPPTRLGRDGQVVTRHFP